MLQPKRLVHEVSEAPVIARPSTPLKGLYVVYTVVVSVYSTYPYTPTTVVSTRYYVWNIYGPDSTTSSSAEFMLSTPSLSTLNV
jgi:hypothetical protein